MKKFITNLDDESLRLKSYYLRAALATTDSLLPDLFVLEDRETKISVGNEEWPGHVVRFIYRYQDGGLRESVIMLWKEDSEPWPLEAANLAYDTHDCYDKADWSWMQTEDHYKLHVDFQDVTMAIQNIGDILKYINDYPEEIEYQP